MFSFSIIYIENRCTSFPHMNYYYAPLRRQHFPGFANRLRTSLKNCMVSIKQMSLKIVQNILIIFSVMSKSFKQQNKRTLDHPPDKKRRNIVIIRQPTCQTQTSSSTSGPCQCWPLDNDLNRHGRGLLHNTANKL